ncbi:MAG: hypothetical protein WC119_02910 [Synergistaceae bacterium]
MTQDKDNTLDDLFDMDGFDDPSEKSEEVSTGINNDVNEAKKSVMDGRSRFPKLIGPESDYPASYRQVVDRFIALYAKLPIINYDELHKEISNLNVESKPTSTLQLINVRLQEIQGAKDRLAEIYQEVVRCYTIKKRAVNILTEAWNKFADGSSADKRKSDSAFRLSDFHADLAEVEALNIACDHSLKNLDSQSNAISRQITIIQSELKLFDIGRGSLPDFDFNKGSLNEGFESLGDFPSNDIDVQKDTDGIGEKVINATTEELSF